MTIKKRSSLNHGCQDVPYLNIFITLQIKILAIRDSRHKKNFTNPGLQHLAENFFVNLNYQDLKTCLLINK